MPTKVIACEATILRNYIGTGAAYPGQSVNLCSSLSVEVAALRDPGCKVSASSLIETVVFDIPYCLFSLRM